MQLSLPAIHTACVWLGGVWCVCSPGDGECSKPVLNPGDCFGEAPVVPTEALPLQRVQTAAKEMLVACCAAHSH